VDFYYSYHKIEIQIYETWTFKQLKLEELFRHLTHKKLSERMLIYLIKLKWIKTETEYLLPQSDMTVWNVTMTADNL
jgi:hypothetical protein